MIKVLEKILKRIVKVHNRIDEKYTLEITQDRSGVFMIYHSRFKHILSIEVRCSEGGKIYVATSIGAGTGGSDYNRSIFERFKFRVKGTDAVENFYSGCSFVSNIRLNTFKTNIWFTAESFNSLEGYLKQFDKIPVTRYRITPQKCFDDLKARQAVGEFQRLQKYRYKFYHWLEFLTISEKFDATPLESGKYKTFENILKAAIQKHIQGMALILKVRQIRNRKKGA